MFQFRFLFLGVLFWGCMQSHAQLLQEDSATMYWQKLTAAGSNEKLFVHLDKSIYTNNEQIWFSAYFLNRQSSLVQKTGIHFCFNHFAANEKSVPRVQVYCG